MPISFLRRSFSPGKSPPRRSVSLSSLRRESDKSGQDLSHDFSKIKLNIGGQNATFEDGEWVAGWSHSYSVWVAGNWLYIEFGLQIDHTISLD